MAHKYLVDLTEEEQGYLLDVIHKGKTAARRVGRAHVLLRATEGVSDEDIAQTLHLGIASVHRIRPYHLSVPHHGTGAIEGW